MIYFLKLSAYDFLTIFLFWGSINSKSILFFFAYSIANSFVENSNFNSDKVSVELSQPINGSIPGSSVLNSIIHLLVLAKLDCITVLVGI